MSMFVKRLAFVLLIVAVLSSLVGAAVAQSEPQQFVVFYVEFKPANARAGGDVLQQLDARAECSAGLIRFDVLQQIDRPNFFALFEVWSNAQTFEDFQNSSETQATQAQRLALQKLFISTPPIVSSKDKGDGNEDSIRGGRS
jgi:quinol monooxygenase YgiN